MAPGSVVQAFGRVQYGDIENLSLYTPTALKIKLNACIMLMMFIKSFINFEIMTLRPFGRAK